MRDKVDYVLMWVAIGVVSYLVLFHPPVLAFFEDVRAAVAPRPYSEVAAPKPSPTP